MKSAVSVKPDNNLCVGSEDKARVHEIWGKLRHCSLDLPDHWPRFAETIVAMVRNVASFADWGAFLLACAIAAFFVRDRWTRMAAAGVVVPMVLLYAAVYAVFEPALWPVSVLSANVAPRLLTHLLGPLTYVYAAATAPATADGS